MPVDLLPLVDDAVPDLRRSDSPAYPRRRFEFLGRPDPHRITADDLIAVGLMGVAVPADVALDLLEGDLGLDVADSLRHVPVDVPISSPDAAALLGSSSAAGVVVDLLEEPAGMSWRAAATLLARKRPLLVPVPDPVVLCALDWTDASWGWALAAFADPRLGERLAEVRLATGLVTTGDLRALEAIAWMRHHRDHLRTRCPGLRQRAA